MMHMSLLKGVYHVCYSVHDPLMAAIGDCVRSL